MNPNMKDKSCYAEDRANSKHDGPVQELRFKQIIDSHEYGLLGLTDDGIVYAYNSRVENWYRISMRIA